MASKKIGAVIALDGEREFTQGVKNAQTAISNLKAESNKLKEESKGQANTLEALQKKHNLLAQSVEAHKNKEAAIRAGLKNSGKAYDEYGKKLEILKAARNDEQKKLEALKKEYGDSSKEVQKQQKVVEQLNKSIEGSELNYQKACARIGNWEAKLKNAEAATLKENKALQENEKYLEEAKKSTNGCASSIDEFGRRIKEAVKTTSGWGEKLGAGLATAVATKGMDIAVAGVKKLGQEAKEAAKYVVESGSSFEAAMSEVEAISGSSGKSLDALTEKAKELGSSTKFSATEAAEALKYMSLAGWSTADMLSGIDGIMSLAAASGMELAAASDMVTDYLSAFGMQASESAKMADMLAFAQAHSNTSAQQLGEAYGNCAANLHTAGQDIETVTAMLEAMANQGLKGSEAGTALNSIMSQITQKMKNGKIAIGDVLVQVQDANGDFRDLTDIVKDVDKAVGGMGTAQKSAALAGTFNRTALAGLNYVLAEGIDKVEGYEWALRDSEGAAKDMAATMQDNLKGAVTAMKSAEEGLGIVLYEKVSGPLTKGVEIATSLINGLTDALTEEKSIVESCIDDIEASNERVSELIHNSQNVMADASGDVSQMEVYKNSLLELNSVTEKTAYQKYKIKSIVSELAVSIPELAAAFNEETGSINLTDKAIRDLFDSKEAYLFQQAALEAETAASNALFEADLNVAIATGAAKDAQEAYNDALKKNQESADYLAGGYGDYYKELMECSSVLDDANKALKESKDLQEEARTEYDSMVEAVDEASKSASKYAGVIAEIPETSEGAADATEELADDAVNASVEISEAFLDMSESIANSVEGSISMLDKFNGGAEVSAEKIQENLQSQIDGIETWSENMQTLAESAGEGMTQEFYDYLAEMGPESANLVQTLVDALESKDGSFKGICDKWTEAMILKDDSDIIASYTSAGNGISEAVRDTVEDHEEEISATLEEQAENMADTLEEAGQKLGEIGREQGEAYCEGVSEGKDHARNAGKTVSEAASDEMKGKVPEFGSIGEDSGKEYAEGIESTSGDARNAAAEVAGAAIDGAGSKAGEMETVGYNMSLGMAQGIRNGESEVINAAIAVAVAAIKAAKKSLGVNSPSKVFRDQVGSSITEGMALGIKSGAYEVKDASVEIAKAALNASKKELEIHSPSGTFKKQVGKQIAKGMAFGIKDNKKLAGDAAEELSETVYRKASAWLAKYKKTHKVSLDEEKYYWQQVLKHVKKGTDAYEKAAEKINSVAFSKQIKKKFGVEKGNDSNENYSKNILSAAQKYLSNYKILHDVSIAEEIEYWEKVKKTLKKGTQAWYDATKTIKNLKESQKKQQEAANDAIISDAEDYVRKKKILGKMDTQRELEYWQNIIKTVKKGSDAWYEAKEKIQDLKEQQAKAAEDANNAIVSSGEDYIRKQKILGTVSVQQELDFWKQRLAMVKQGSDAWYDIAEKINELQDELNEAAVQAIEDAKEAAKKVVETRANVQNKLLSSYKTYHKMSAKAEAEYWDIARKQFKEGTDERIEADQKYFDALQRMYDDRKELDEQYEQDQQDINDRMIENIADLENAYKEAVKSRKQEILSSMNLFEAWDSSGYDGDTLLYNLKTQVAGLTLWEQQLEELSKKNLSADLLKELREMGPDAAASIYSLNQMTAQQLEEYDKLWQQRNTLAESQALKENETLRKQNNLEIAQIRKDAQAELDELNKNYKVKLEELNTGLADGLKNLVYKAGSIAEESVAALIAGLEESSDSVEVYNGTQKVVKAISGGLVNLEQEGIIIGKSTLDGILKGLTDEAKITAAARTAITSVKRAMQEAADIHSPSRLFEKEIGLQISAGVGNGILKGSSDLADQAKRMVSEALSAAQEEMARISSCRVDRLNQAVENIPSETIVIKTDNSDMNSAIGKVIQTMEAMQERIERLQVVMDSGELVGTLQPMLDMANAEVAIRNNRGRY